MLYAESGRWKFDVAILGYCIWAGLRLEAMSVADGGTDCEDCSILPLGLIGFAMVRSFER